MQASAYLNNHFLIAMPGLGDPNFQRSVTFICRHDAEGALGIVINRPLDLTVGAVLEQLSLNCTNKEAATRQVLEGGPVQRELGFVIHTGSADYEASLDISEDLKLTTSRDILGAIAAGDGPDKALFALGYAGWDAGQLDRELADNAWLSVPSEDHILFDAPFEQRWSAAARLLGVDIEQLNLPAGHA